MISCYVIFIRFVLIAIIIKPYDAGIAPPHWADVRRNPCATHPQGWLLLYWPPDKSCYRIFQLGYPCPPTMELTPSKAENLVAECRCPPGTAQISQESDCFQLFQKGPCDKNQYFAPAQNSSTESELKRWGECITLESCPLDSQLRWPLNGQCYQKFSRGPCPEGKLLTIDASNSLPYCHCDNSTEMMPFYYSLRKTCHEPYTKGPCVHKGQLFLPGGKCGCDPDLPHYYKKTHECYKLGDIGPCPPGHQFKISQRDVQRREKVSGKCMCKEKHIYWKPDGVCYRLYTQGPCSDGMFLINSTTCIDVPCKRGQLYFPKLNECHRIGTQGPCFEGEVVSFDYTVRPSIEGISYHGTCDCSVGEKLEECRKNAVSIRCDYGKVLMDGICHMLYTQGPCSKEQWLMPKRTGKWRLWSHNENSQNGGVCRCRPGYTEVKIVTNEITTIKCESPSVTLASYLNTNFLKSITMLDTH